MVGVVLAIGIVLSVISLIAWRRRKKFKTLNITSGHNSGQNGENDSESDQSSDSERDPLLGKSWYCTE